jgi:hypothetical protein
MQNKANKNGQAAQKMVKQLKIPFFPDVFQLCASPILKILTRSNLTDSFTDFFQSCKPN